MGKKHWLLATNFITLLVSGILLSTFSFAWINNNRFVDHIELQIGEAQAQVQGYMFKRQHSGLTTYTNLTPELNESLIASDQGQLTFTFEDASGTFFSDFSLADLYLNENTLNANAFPAYFVELQLFANVPLSYLKISLMLPDYVSPEIVPAFSDFSYRFMVQNNNALLPLEYATPAPNGVDILSTYGLINMLSGVTNYDPTINNLGPYDSLNGRIIDENNSEQITLMIPAGEQGFYYNHFLKSVVVEITPDPLAFYQFIYNNPDLADNDLLFGRKLQFNFQYSLVPFGVTP